MNKMTLSIVAILFFAASLSFARGGGDGGIYLGFNLLPSSLNMKAAQPSVVDSKTSGMNYDALIGYAFSSGLYLGVMMGSASSTDTNDVKTTSQQTGASLGFMKNAFSLVLHYFLSASTDDGSTPSNKMTGGGIGADIGYLFPVGNIFKLGAAIQYRSLSYKKLTIGATSTEVDTDLVTTYYQPVLSFGFMF